MFITVEGLDGSGTTTLSESLADALEDTVLTQEPSDSWYGYDIRNRMGQENSDPLIDTYLFFVDRVGHLREEIEPALDRGKTVICDRYADSTRAYQPITLHRDDPRFDSSWEAKAFIEQSMAPWLREPDLTLYLQIDPEEAIESASEDEKYESLDMLVSVEENYRALAQTQDRIETIDASMSKEAVLRDALSVARRRW